MARRKRGGLTARPSGKTAMRYGGGHEEEAFGRKQAGIRIRKGHGRSKHQRKIATGRM